MKYKIGNVVQLASGGPLMTVTETGDEDMLKCDSFDKNTPRSSWFPESAIVLADQNKMSDEQLGRIARQAST
jgi:uncharacterized protein YodC (DUF2158 family)